jgi:meiotic recombination protein REC8, fungi type
MNSSNPISAEAIIPVSSSDVSGIPSIALQIPDFEGYATLRVFSNATRTEIGCFQAVMRNGVTFSQVSTVSPILGFFAFVAVIASFVTAIYGVSITAMRTHHAHSLSVLVVFEVFQSIFFSGALSLNWPSVLAAWWSNFAWSAGMIYTREMTKNINHFTGNNANSSQVGGAGSTTLNNNGGLTQEIYGRSLDAMSKDLYNSVLRGYEVASRIYSRGTANSTNATTYSGVEYSWNGGPVGAGLLVPGNWSGFAGELSEINIPVSNAFMTGFLWFLILLACLIGATTAFKWSLEGLSAMKWIKEDRLALFRSHWLGFLGLILLRTLFIGFFMITTLALFQLSIHGTAGVMAIAAVIFLIFLVGVLGIAGYACFYRLRFGHYESSPDRLYLKGKKAMKFLPWFGAVRQSSMGDAEAPKRTSGGMPFFRVRYIDNDPSRTTVHRDQVYVKKFGWLSARYRRTRWWFFAVWAGYQLIRACFIGGASRSPEAQVFGLFVVEIIALIAIVWINPFEGARNTALAVYMLGISKVATTGLSIAFLPSFNLDRIVATVIGVIIIVIQGFLTIGLLILIVLGAISSWFSLTRNREDFKPESWEGLRVKYFHHLESRAPDLPPPPPKTPEPPKEPYFNVSAVRRAPKIEDEDDDILPDLENPAASNFSLPVRGSRTASIHSHYSGYGNLPYGARIHRASWSSRDFANWQQEGIDSPSRAPSRQTSGNYTSHTEISMAPLARPPSMASIKSAAPNREYRNRFANERFNTAK